MSSLLAMSEHDWFFLIACSLIAKAVSWWGWTNVEMMIRDCCLTRPNVSVRSRWRPIVSTPDQRRLNWGLLENRSNKTEMLFWKYLLLLMPLLSFCHAFASLFQCLRSSKQATFNDVLYLIMHSDVYVCTRLYNTFFYMQKEVINCGDGEARDRHITDTCSVELWDIRNKRCFFVTLLGAEPFKIVRLWSTGSHMTEYSFLFTFCFSTTRRFLLYSDHFLEIRSRILAVQ